MPRSFSPLLLLCFAMLVPNGGEAVPLPPVPVVGLAAIVPAQVAPRAKAITGDQVRGERVATGPGERMQVLFADGTTITLGPSSELDVDSFVFDRQAGTAQLSASLRRGFFRIIGGQTARTSGGVTLATPFGTVTVDHGAADLSLGDAETPPHFDLIFGGSISLARGGSVAARVHEPGYSIAPDPGGGSRASVRKTPPEWRAAAEKKLP